MTQGSDPTDPVDNGQAPPPPPAPLPFRVRIYTSASIDNTNYVNGGLSGLLTPYRIKIYRQNISTGVETLVHTTGDYGGTMFALNEVVQLPNISNDPNQRYAAQIDLPTIGTGEFDQPYRQWSFFLNISLADNAGTPFVGIGGFEPISQTFGTVASTLLRSFNIYDPLYRSYRAVLSPIRVAPAILAVNSDFDEGRIDPATGYAIPDCDDANIALEARRNHLDGKYATNTRITEDMHPGFFGLLPSGTANDSFWTGATVTIGKIDKIDPATGYAESGHIRLYGKWGAGASEYRAIVPYDFDTLAKVNLVTGGINGAPAESVYGPTSPFPSYTSYFIEGVHPGKITLEWKYVKGIQTFKHEQAFEVVTQKSATAWKSELAYKIRLETSNDPSGQIDVRNVILPTESYETRMELISEYYDYYQDCFLSPLRSPPLQPQALGWPGLARLAGSQVVGGLSDSEYGKRITQSGITIVDPLGLIPSNLLNLQWPVLETEQLQQALFTGARTIFQSTGWQMHAYRSSGYRALDWVAGTGEPESVALVARDVWKNLRQGILDHNKALLDQAALDTTDREQNVTIVPAWTTISSLGVFGIVDWTFTYLATNPCTPSGGNFKAMFPAGTLSNTVDRWNWIRASTPNGILDTWNTLPQANRAAFVGSTLKSDATRFRYFPLSVLVNDDQDIK
jgi:hypothetical protein